MDIPAIQNLLQQEKLMRSPVVTPLGSGEGNENFLASDDTEVLVVRCTRQDIPDKRTLTHEHTQLRFLEHEQITFAPRSLFYDPQREVHVVSFMQGEDTSIAELPDDYVPLFAAQLATLEQLSYDRFRIFCDTTNTPLKEPIPPDVLFEKVGTDWFAVIASHKDQADVAGVMEWLEGKHSYVQDVFMQRPHRVRYRHGDLRWFPGGGNLRLNPPHLGFIDWEGAGFVDDCRLELGDVIASLPDPEAYAKKIEMLVSEYCKAVSKSEDEVREALDLSIHFSKLTDVLWSAQKFLLLRDAGSAEWQRYHHMTLDRMRMGDYYFKTPKWG